MKLTDYISLYPSIAAVISGVLAIVITFIPPSTMTSKVIWLSAFVFIALTAIIATFWQQSILNQKDLIQSQRDIERDKDFAFLKGQMTSLIQVTATPHPTSDEETKRLSMVLKKINTIKVSNPVSNEPSLKKRALLLSTEILQFVASRSRTEGPINQSTWNEDMKEFQRYNQETMNIYSVKFASKAISICSELAAKDLTDQFFQTLCNNPVHINGIKMVGEQMGAYANRLH